MSRVSSLRKDLELTTGGWKAIACCEYPALPSETMVKSHLMLMIRSMSAPMTRYLQGLVSISVVHITTRDHGLVSSMGPHMSRGCEELLLLVVEL